MGSGAVDVVEMPGFISRYSVDFSKYDVETCGPYNPLTNSFKFGLYSHDGSGVKTYEYDLGQGKVIGL
jgi:hypothetical protein